MEEASDYRRWDELIPDALGLIFKNLSLYEILTVIPRVCKSWGKAVVGPYCWQEIDIDDWSKECCFPRDIDRMLQMLITRSAGSLRKLSVSGTGLHDDGIFSFIADHAGSVHTMRLPRSEITDPIVESIAGRLSTLSFLDLSYCNRIGAHALEAIGKNCKMLLGLCRNMHPVDTAGKSSLDDEAHAIAFTMSKLRRLEMSYHLVSTQSVLEIIYNCPELEFLDLRGCHHAELDEKFLKERYPKLKVLGPDVVDEYERNEWEDYSDFSDFSEYLAWEFVAGEVGDYYDNESLDEMWDDEGRLEDLELRFYEGIEDAGLYGWPPSP
ncbi:F-box protein FBW2 [Syzygium oleosum]|uniref:F-box protein FBW2 n=1 Tax=Syzygium oleosum TaxID=219896 RepID=UPI0011D2B5C2|nr:F-box protein FBW2 [Syzygium oleosum]XP_030455101.1 F-box protein FBW2 [Syzygium oleosum]XP_056167254.1 F-box protein FBW2 [Syzygium oleosum]XP_056167255.1 F-box protein FBW2 [Syzygium oleosum]XP_056167256.1 F-box protein FBW2 [Syzygium oleosum]XP_056167257.1 F-box protein FBW2 [Syzygium oleosum]